MAGAPAALRGEWLPKMAAGDAVVVPALQERRARYQLSHVTTTATQSGGGWVLTGQKSVVPAADEAVAFVVPARISEALTTERDRRDPGGGLLGVRSRGAGEQEEGEAAAEHHALRIRLLRAGRLGRQPLRRGLWT